MLHYEIWQMPSKLFAENDIRITNRDFSLVNIENYNIIYEDDMTFYDENDDIFNLETLFEIFNIRHPKDFHGHSLSVGDVVKLGNEYYVCDVIGFEKIKNFC